MKCETSENQFEEHELANSFVSTWKAQKCVSILSKAHGRQESVRAVIHSREE